MGRLADSMAPHLYDYATDRFATHVARQLLAVAAGRPLLPPPRKGKAADQALPGLASKVGVGKRLRTHACRCVRGLGSHCRACLDTLSQPRLIEPWEPCDGDLSPSFAPPICSTAALVRSRPGRGAGIAPDARQRLGGRRRARQGGRRGGGGGGAAGHGCVLRRAGHMACIRWTVLPWAVRVLSVCVLCVCSVLFCV
jgi:hypothetical protein